MTEKILTGIDVRSLFFPVIVMFFWFFTIFKIYIFLTQSFIKLNNYVFMVDISGNITWKTTFL